MRYGTETKKPLNAIVNGKSDNIIDVMQQNSILSQLQTQITPYLCIFERQCCQSGVSSVSVREIGLPLIFCWSRTTARTPGHRLFRSLNRQPSIIFRGPTKSDFRYRYIATKIPYRPGIPSTILYYRSRKYARINISRVTMPDNAWD